MSDDFGMSAPLSAIPETGHSYTAPPPAEPMPTVLVLTGLGAAVGPASRHKKRPAARCPYEWAWAEGRDWELANIAACIQHHVPGQGRDLGSAQVGLGRQPVRQP
jgi:hypothetical protein